MAVLGYAVLGHTVLGQPDVATGWGQTGIVTLAEVKEPSQHRRHGHQSTTTSCGSCSTTCSASWRPRRPPSRCGTSSRPARRARRGWCSTRCRAVLDVRPARHDAGLGLVVDGSPVDVVDRRLDGPGLSWCRTSAGSASAYADRGAVATYRAGYASTRRGCGWPPSVSSSTCGSAPSRPRIRRCRRSVAAMTKAAPSTASYLLPYAVMSLIERHRALV